MSSPEPSMIGIFACILKFRGRSTASVAESRGTFDMLGTSNVTELLANWLIASVRFITSANSSTDGNPLKTSGGGNWATGTV
jgi:hypothetical protein